MPNLVTLLRFALVLPITALILSGGHAVETALLTAVFGATDWVDGWLARRLGQVSRVGEALDPIADRVGIVCIAVALAAAGTVPWWSIAVFPAVDLVVAGVFAFRRREHELDVSRIGKLRTGIAMVGIVVAILGEAPGMESALTVGQVAIAAAALLHIVAGAGYLRHLLRPKDGDHGRHADRSDLAGVSVDGGL
ncbi:CDP-alcohol phosphatidyltransferase family protein [Salininema proteolyticum]|uniref:CDP-alcohol phosphatidyltransferase family protein n=1 Tax=Salininema proteolyticum TaxID=1607685 RepID=A0ABV8TU41_9ACTN